MSPDFPDSWITLHNDAVALAIDRRGGALVSFTFRDLPLNPFDWRMTREEMPRNNQAGAAYQGHFLCQGRWGPPTDGERQAGIPDNGEPANREWTVTARPGPGVLDMEVEAPLERWRIRRTVTLPPGAVSQVVVEETLINLLPFARFTTWVQHGTLGGDFLEESTVMDTNATAGFSQARLAAAATNAECNWPSGPIDSTGRVVDLRRPLQTTDHVTTHVVDGEWGWATVATPPRGLLLGYLWKTSEYPWLHVWNGVKEGRLWARGVEFGTTGLSGRVDAETRATHTFRGRRHFFSVDAHASVTRRYVCFLRRITPDFRATLSVGPLDDGGVAVRFE